MSNGYMTERDQLSMTLGALNRRLGSLERMVPERAPEPAPEAVIEDWVSFVFNVTLNADGTGVDTELNDATGHFDLVFVTGISDGNYRLRVRDGEQGKHLTANATFIDHRNFVGTSERPYFLKGRRRFRANTTIIMEFTEISGLPNDIEVALHGIKVSI